MAKRCRTRKSAVFVEIENKKENNLGIPLPKGTVRVYKKDSEGEPAVCRRRLNRSYAEG